MKVNLPEVRVQVTLLLIILNLLQALLGLLQFKKLGFFNWYFVFFLTIFVDLNSFIVHP